MANNEQEQEQSEEAHARNAERETYKQSLRDQGLAEGSSEWDAKMEEWNQQNAPGQTRERKLSEVTPPSELKVQLENKAMAKVREHAKEVDKRSKALSKDKHRQEEIAKLQAEQREADDNERIQKQVANLETRHQDGSLTDSEYMELMMHPHHVNIGSGHGNPA